MIYANKLGKLLNGINSINRQNGGFHLVFVDCDSLEGLNLRPNTLSEVYFVTDEQYENGFESPNASMCELTTLSLVKEVVSAALKVKSNASESDLVKCLLHYLEKDSFYDFD